MIERLADERWFVLRNLAMILGEVGDQSMVEHLSSVYDHRDARVRREAIASTIRLGGPQAAPLLVRALGEEDPEVYLMAIHGLSVSTVNPLACHACARSFARPTSAARAPT